MDFIGPIHYISNIENTIRVVWLDSIFKTSFQPILKTLFFLLRRYWLLFLQLVGQHFLKKIISLMYKALV